MEFVNTLPKGSILNGETYRYEVIEPIGQGSFGIAYKAKMFFKTQNESGVLVEKSEIVAVKEFFIKKQNGRSGSSVTEGSSHGIFSYYKKEFEHEANNLRYMVHPHIVQVYELFYGNDTVYYSMKFLNKKSLDNLIAEKGKLNENEALRFLQDIGSALSCMHDYKMLHLDLKPGNIMINDQGEAVLIDFGLSKRYNQDGTGKESTDIGKGTPGYAPIEQSNQTGNGDFAATMDIYALGATLFKMLTGQRPPLATEIKLEGFPAYILQEAGVDERIMPAVAKAMNPDKNKRFQTVDEFINACLPEPDYDKADDLEAQADDATTNIQRIALLKECFAADPTRLEVAKRLDDYFMDIKDYVQSAEWCLKAAKLGDSEAQRDIGDMYACGDGVPQNDYLAVKWYREAAYNGNSNAQTRLAEMYYAGKGVPQDFIEAARWYKMVVDSDPKNTESIYSLGYMYEYGQGVPQDYLKAAQLYEKVADAHEAKGIKLLDTICRIPDCMFRLAYLYQFGLGVTTNYTKAIHYYQKAIKYNHATAMFNLGCMYMDGQGVPVNQEMAVQLWQDAVNVKVYDDEEISSGGLYAMFNLGVCYERGWGCTQNYETALYWYNKAIEHGHEKAESAIQNLKNRMTEERKSNGLLGKLKKWLS